MKAIVGAAAAIFPAAIILLPVPGCAQDVAYEDRVLKIMEEKCFQCHGDGKSKGSVNLDPETLDRITRDRKLFVAGDAEASAFYKIISLPEDDDDRMPPPGKGDPLSNSELAAVRAWIEGGMHVAALTAEPDEDEENENAAMASAPAPEEWTNLEGRTITATLLRVDGEIAVLRMENGRVYNYPIEKLDADSQTRVRKAAGS